MSGSDGGNTLYVEGIEGPLWERLESDSRTKKEAVVQALEREYTTTEKARLQMRLDHRRQQKQMLERERRELDEEIGRLQDEMAAMEQQIENIEADQQSYEEVLDGLLELLKDGKNVWPGHGKVTGLEDSHGVKPDEAIADLKELAEERDLSIPDSQFEDGANGGGLR